MKKVLLCLMAVLIIGIVKTEPVSAASFQTVKTTTSKSKKTTKKNEKLSKKASSTKTVTTKATKILPIATTQSSNKDVKKTTTIKTTTTKKTKKGSKIRSVSVVTETTIVTQTTTYYQGYLAIRSLAPKADSRILTAFDNLGFKLKINRNVNYAGHYSTSDRLITLKYADETVYHELGHFLAFVSGNTDKSSSFVSIYNSEKSKYVGFNKNYVTQNSSEYFAESYQDYVLNNSKLKQTRPKTYAAIKSSLDKVTTSQINKVKTIYAPIWR